MLYDTDSWYMLLYIYPTLQNVQHQEETLEYTMGFG